MRTRLIPLLIVAIAPGCTNIQLRNRTVDQASTLTDLQYQQVLNNLAMFCKNPSALPWHVNLRDGSAQVADLRSGTLGAEFSHAAKATPTLLGARTVVEQWGMTPVTDDIELKLIRLAYRRALGLGETLEGPSGENELANDLAHELKKQTPDFNEFANQADRLLDEGRKRYLNEKLREMLRSPSKDTLPDLIFPFRYLISGYHAPLDNYTYLDYQDIALSIVDEQIIIPGEKLGDDDQTNYKFNNYNVNLKARNELFDRKKPFVNSYGYKVFYVTPLAAEMRRQVKEVEKDLRDIHPGWYHVGGKKDVPKDACYVGCYRDCYVWVCPDGLEGLTQFTLKVLSFASLIKDPTIFTTPGPRFTPASGFPSL